MSEVEAEAPPVLERGRYALYGSGKIADLVIARATDLCDQCANCGCGTQQPNYRPMDSIKEMLRSGPGELWRMMKAMGSHDGT